MTRDGKCMILESAHFEDLRVVKITSRHLWEMGLYGWDNHRDDSGLYPPAGLELGVFRLYYHYINLVSDIQ
jgi:hypothetical protein